MELLFFEDGQKPVLKCHPAKTQCNASLCEIYDRHHFQFEYVAVHPLRIDDLQRRQIAQRGIGVERLIHIELADLRVRGLGPCAECGKEHREWFEIEACKDALRRVDQCVRRWVVWAGGDV